MSAADALITAMHTAGGSTARPVSEWLALSQEHAALRDAFRASHGKRLPTPQAFGLWLSERTGKTAGPLRLEGKHSAKRKGWIYRVVDYVKLAELARQEAERQAQLRAELEAKQRELIAATRPTVVMQAPEPVDFTPLKDKPAPEYEYCYPQNYDSTGRALPRRLVINPRDGQPVLKRSAATEQPKPAEKSEPEPEQEPIETRSDDHRPPWLQRGESQPKNKKEWLAWQRRRGSQIQPDSVNYQSSGFGGFVDPGGVVSANRDKEMGALHRVHVAGYWPK